MYPRWISKDPYLFLRQVAPLLYVGAEGSPRARQWGLVVNFYGHGAIPRTEKLLSLPFIDGDSFPEGALDTAYEAVYDALCQRKPVLLHCQAGLSRSASAAYAMLRSIYGLSHEEAHARIHTTTEMEAGPKKWVYHWPRTKTLASAREWNQGFNLRKSQRTNSYPY
jgi:protein-tyrosine phosphatase